MHTAPRVSAGRARLATPEDDEAIHGLNYRTFVEEIPQHPPNTERRLVDRFHAENVYVVYEADDRVVGMVCGRPQRPFSLDEKLGPIDRWLPPHTRAVEIRLLAVEPAYRATRVCVRLLEVLTAHFASLGYDLAVLSGTTRQLPLYAHLGCVPFAHVVGSAQAAYQPMYLELERAAAHRVLATASASDAPRTGDGPAAPGPHLLLPGPVAMPPAVHAAFRQPPASHRSADFLNMHGRVRHRLAERTGASHATLLLGSGTLANDVVGAQLGQLPGTGVVLVNGEFGERLVDHARRHTLRFVPVRVPWGSAFTAGGVTAAIEQALPTTPVAWIWAVHSETSTGVVNDLAMLRAVAQHTGARLALDAISSVGAIPLSLDGVWMASAVSGKAVASYAGVAIILHHHLPEPSPAIPRYLDLGLAVQAGGVPFTQSSNLVAALDASLQHSDWDAQYAVRRHWGPWIRAALEANGLTVVAPAETASPVVQTIALPPAIPATTVGHALRAEGWHLAFESDYLRARNWLQLCTMGAITGGAVRAGVRRLAAACREIQPPHGGV